MTVTLLSHNGNYLRVRGEYATPLRVCGLNMELPPRARRIPPYGCKTATKNGTTSACAENTGNQPASSRQNRNYLRVRGEYAGVAGTAVLVGELPPRARRIREHEATRGGEVGTTSACAENTGLIRVRFSPLRNYLRVRGEYESMILWSNICKELPPRARRIHSDGMIFL